MGTMRPIGKLQARAGSCKEGLSDEHAEAEAAHAPPGRDIGLAELLENVGREARAVVLDPDRDPLVAEQHRDRDRVCRELDRVFDQVREPVLELRGRCHHRLRQLD